RRRGRSRGVLERELRDKGVAEAHIARAVGEIDESDDRRQAAELVRGRLDRRPRAALSGPDVQGERRRLIAFLARRGYPTGLAVKVVDAELAAHASP
ncbi:RecX family transcriptional regulator, partial [Dietzia maris]